LFYNLFAASSAKADLTPFSITTLADNTDPFIAAITTESPLERPKLLKIIEGIYHNLSNKYPKRYTRGEYL